MLNVSVCRVQHSCLWCVMTDVHVYVSVSKARVKSRMSPTYKK